ncbi:MAG: type VI secretion protein IcmF/TssM N-terminal domain-containing protein, partial [Planctomycetota bacterium]
IEAELERSVPGAAAAPAAEPQFTLSQRLTGMQAVLHKQGRADLMQAKPWYLMIGPTDAGTSSVLDAADVERPVLGLEARLTGSTDMRWQATEQGFFLDVDGGLVDDPHRDEQWRDLLCNIRQRHGGVDGLVLCIDLPRLLSASEQELTILANSLRDRIDDAVERLGVVCPLYLLCTKADLVRGFSSFYQQLPTAQAGAACGFSLPYQPRDLDSTMSELARGFDALYDRIRSYRPAAVRGAGEQVEEALAYPAQFAAAQVRLQLFIREFLRIRPLLETALLRGVWFCSARQEGVPLDLLAKQEDASLPVTPQANDPARRRFVTGFMRDALCEDPASAYLTGERAQAERRRLRNVMVASAAIAALLIVGMAFSYRHNLRLVRLTHNAVLHGMADDGVQSPESALRDLEALASVLERLDAYDQGAEPLRMAWGLYAGDELFPGARRAWLARISDPIVAPVVDRLAQDLAQQVSHYSTSGHNGMQYYESLYRRYLILAMLCADMPHDPQELQRLLRGADDDDLWLSAIFPDAAVVDQTSLVRAQEQLRVFTRLARFAPEWRQRDFIATRHGDVVDRARQLLHAEQDTWINLAYGRMLQEALATSGYGTDMGSELLHGDGVTDLFRYEQAPRRLFGMPAWQQYVQPQLRSRARRLAGLQRKLGHQDADEDVLYERFLELYADDWREDWRLALSGLRVRALTSSDAARAALDQVASDSGAYAAILAEIGRRQPLQLGAFDERNAPELDPDGEWLDSCRDHLRQAAAAIGRFEADRGRRQRYQALDELAQMRDAISGASTGIDEAVAAIADPEEQAAIRRHLQDLLRSALLGVGSEVLADLDRLWRQEVVGPFRRDLDGRFPFAPDAEHGAALAAVQAFFDAEHGAIARVQRHVDAVLAVAPILPLSASYQRTLTQVETIRRQLLTAAGGLELNLAFRQRRGVEDIRLTIGDQAAGLYDTPTRSGRLLWRPSEDLETRLAIRVAPEVWLNQRYVADPWGPLRLLQQGSLSEHAGGLRAAWRFDAMAGPVEHVDAPEAADADDAVESIAPVDQQERSDVVVDTAIAPEVVGPSPVRRDLRHRGRGRDLSQQQPLVYGNQSLPEEAGPEADEPVALPAPAPGNAPLPYDNYEVEIVFGRSCSERFNLQWLGRFAIEDTIVATGTEGALSNVALSAIRK